MVARAARRADAGLVTVLVCGEPLRGDDAAAIEAVRRIPPATADRADVWIVGQLDPLDLLDADGPVLVLDALRGPAPGTIVELDLQDLVTDERPGAGATWSSHALSLASAVAIAAQLRDGPLEGRVVGLAGRSFGVGEPLSAPVRAALPAYCALVTDRIDGLARAAAGRRATAAAARGRAARCV